VFPSLSERSSFLTEGANGIALVGVKNVSISFREKFLPDMITASLAKVVFSFSFHLFQREVPS